jgi:hypothetical protein
VGCEQGPQEGEEEQGPTSLASPGSPRELQAAAAAQQCQPASLSLAPLFSLVSCATRGPSHSSDHAGGITRL